MRERRASESTFTFTYFLGKHFVVRLMVVNKWFLDVYLRFYPRECSPLFVAQKLNISNCATNKIQTHSTERLHSSLCFVIINSCMPLVQLNSEIVFVGLWLALSYIICSWSTWTLFLYWWPMFFVSTVLTRLKLNYKSFFFPLQSDVFETTVCTVTC